MIGIDCHLHTVYSGHGSGSIEEVCRAAEACGLGTIAFTEHLPLPAEVDPACEFSMSADEEARYRAEIEQARSAHPSLTIVRGCEADWRPGAAAYIMQHLVGYDFKLGSVHMLADGYCFDDPACVDGWKTRGADAIWKEYFDLWFDAVSSDVGFTSMAHPDLVKKFGIFPTFDPTPLYRRAARLAVEHGVCMEVSTAGLRKPVGEFYPSRAFLEICRAEGVRFTVGSDAHSPAEVGYRIADAYDYLISCGITAIEVPGVDGSLSACSLV